MPYTVAIWVNRLLSYCIHRGAEKMGSKPMTSSSLERHHHACLSPLQRSKASSTPFRHPNLRHYSLYLEILPCGNIQSNPQPITYHPGLRRNWLMRGDDRYRYWLCAVICLLNPVFVVHVRCCSFMRLLANRNVRQLALVAECQICRVCHHVTDFP